MDYKLYTTVDITHTKQHRNEVGKEANRWREQNFQTVLQTLGIRGNINFSRGPEQLAVSGKLIGFNTERIINVWRFDFSSELANIYGPTTEPVAFLKEDFELVPYISGLDESMEQNYNVFVTSGPATNIVFHCVG